MSDNQDFMTALTIRLQDELFAVEASRVREILDLVPITEVPAAPAFVGGLINVRGRVVPLADLRIVFGMTCRPADEDTRIVVLETEIEGEATVVGIIADKVHEVTDIEASSVESAPRVGMRWRPDLVAAIGKRNGDFIIIPDLGRIFEIEGGRSGPVASERAA